MKTKKIFLIQAQAAKTKRGDRCVQETFGWGGEGGFRDLPCTTVWKLAVQAANFQGTDYDLQSA